MKTPFDELNATDILRASAPDVVSEIPPDVTVAPRPGDGEATEEKTPEPAKKTPFGNWKEALKL